MPGLSVSAQTRLLVVAPHPDDETLGCGVLIQQVLAAGGAVHLLLLTDGDKNPWPQRYIERRLRIAADSRRRWGERRRAEMAQAMARLAVPASVLQSLGWPDGAVTRQLSNNTQSAIAAVHAVLHTFKPNIVACPDLGDIHPDHSAAHVLCRLALADADPRPLLLAYPVHGRTEPLAWPVLADVDETRQRRKLAALAEHRTQMLLSGRRMRRLALMPERYKPIETLDGDGRLPWRPPAVLKPWLRLLLVSQDGARDWCWSEAPLLRDQDGGFRLQWSSATAESRPLFAKLHLDWPSPWIFDHWGWHAL